VRYQRAADIEADPKRLKRDTDLGRAVRSAAVPAAVAGASRSHQEEEHGQDARATAGETPALRRRWALAGLVALIAASGLVWFLTHRVTPPQPSAELTQKRLTFNPSENPVLSSAISPDGKYLAYSDAAGIHVKLFSTGDERVIPLPAGVPSGASWFLDSWFPDGTQLLADTAGAGAHHSMWTVSILGQSPRELREGASGYEVSPDGRRIVFSPGVVPEEFREIWVMGIDGDNPQKVLALREHEWLSNVHWSPDGQRLAYLKGQHTETTPSAAGIAGRSSIETCDLKGANLTVVVPYSDLWLSDFCWLPDGRIVYSRRESLDSNDDNLWQISINGHAGAPAGNPKRVTQWAGSSLGNPEALGMTHGALYASADGKRLTFLKTTHQWQLYSGELAAGGERMNPPRRLTNDESNNVATAWTPDSKAVLFHSDRNGIGGIFKQGINQDTAEPVVTGPRRVTLPRLSSDGAWILYTEFPKHLAAPPHSA